MEYHTSAKSIAYVQSSGGRRRLEYCTFLVSITANLWSYMSIYHVLDLLHHPPRKMRWMRLELPCTSKMSPKMVLLYLLLMHYGPSENPITELIFNYMNGPRTLSNDHLSYLVISSSAPSSETISSDGVEYDLMMCAPHYTGDGTALHQSTHDLLCILTSTQTNKDLQRELDEHRDWVRSRNYLPVYGRLTLDSGKYFATGL